VIAVSYCCNRSWGRSDVLLVAEEELLVAQEELLVAEEARAASGAADCRCPGDVFRRESDYQPECQLPPQ